MKKALFLIGILSLTRFAFADQKEPLLVLEAPANFTAFISAYDLGGKIDLQQANQERHDMMTALFGTLSDTERETILRQTLAYKAGQLTLAPYVSNVVRLCERHNLSLQNYPSFEQYLRYLFIVDGVSTTQFFS